MTLTLTEQLTISRLLTHCSDDARDLLSKLVNKIDEQDEMNQHFRERIQCIEMTVSAMLPKDFDMHKPVWPPNIISVEEAVKTLRPMASEDCGV